MASIPRYRFCRRLAPAYRAAGSFGQTCSRKSISALCTLYAARGSRPADEPPTNMWPLGSSNENWKSVLSTAGNSRSRTNDSPSRIATKGSGRQKAAYKLPLSLKRGRGFSMKRSAAMLSASFFSSRAKDATDVRARARRCRRRDDCLPREIKSNGDCDARWRFWRHTELGITHHTNMRESFWCVPDHFTAAQIAAVLAAFLDGSPTIDLNQKLIVLEPGRVRIRTG